MNGGCMMEILVQRKSLGRSRKLEQMTYELPEKPHTLRELLTMLVQIEVSAYNEGTPLLTFITEDQQQDLKATGYVKFLPVAERPDVDNTQAIDTMLQAFEDGLFKVLQGSDVYSALEEEIQWSTEPWTFIKLTFLAGR